MIKEEPHAWTKLITSARPVVEYIIDAIVAEVDPNDAKAKSAAAARAMPVIRDVTNAIERDHHTQHLARRLGIHELIEGTPEIKLLVKREATSQDLAKQAIKDGMTTLKQDGIQKVFDGLTDIHEVRRVCVE